MSSKSENQEAIVHCIGRTGEPAESNKLRVSAARKRDSRKHYVEQGEHHEVIELIGGSANAMEANKQRVSSAMGLGSQMRDEIYLVRG